MTSRLSQTIAAAGRPALLLLIFLAAILATLAGSIALFMMILSKVGSYRNSAADGPIDVAGTLSIPLSRAAANGRTSRANGLLPHLGLEDPAWHHLQLTMTGNALTAALGGQTVTTVADNNCTTGPAGIETNWTGVQFDNLTINPTN